ncbi:hypothetical protein [Klebsiella pneumoniae]|uniref:hypothetical protein n=1 Tax=Klebsiella pneumoniae TaxID=573 RepID=UPI001D17D9CF|nr:hypothetical protein [Klebsiella pneumoniae]
MTPFCNAKCWVKWGAPFPLQQAAPVDAPAAEPVDPRKAAVEAAIARAKARKAEQQAAPVDAPAVG